MTLSLEGARTGARPRGWAGAAVRLGLVAGLVVPAVGGCSGEVHRAAGGAGAVRVAAVGTRSAAGHTHTTPVVPVPSPTAQPWGSCGNIRDEADARDLVAAGEADALVEARVDGSVVRSYRVLVGHVDGLSALNDGLTVRPGHYLLLPGGGAASHYAAFGYYGVYRVVGDRAYQSCAYGGPRVPRGGVTDVGRIVELLRSALSQARRRTGSNDGRQRGDGQ